MSQMLSAKVIIEEEEPQIRSIEGVQTAITGVVGVAERGPVGVATLCQSFDEYVAIFGGFIANSDMTLAAMMYFDNGGVNLWVVRTVHYSDITNASTKTSAKATLTLNTTAISPTSGSVTGSTIGPFVMVTGETLVLSINGGGNLTATFTATAAARESGAGTFALSNGQQLTVSIDGGAVQTVTFLTGQFVAIGAATAAEVVAVLNGQLVGASASVTNTTHVTITSDRKGTGSGVNVTGGSANGGILAFTTGNVAGGGNVSNIAAVTVSEVKTIVEAAVAGCTVSNSGVAVKITSNTTGASSSVLVVASSTADTEFGLDNATHTGLAGTAAPTLTVAGKTDGAYANGIKAIVKAASSGDSDKVDFCVQDSGVTVETFPNVSMTDTDDDYIEKVVNDPIRGSKLVAVTDLDATAPSPGDLPAIGTFGPLTGGSDGLSSIADTDFIGTQASATGLRALDVVQDLSVLMVPGRATAAMHAAMITYCETTRDGAVFSVLDPPANQTASGIKTYVTQTAALKNLSEYGAIYWPRIQIVNPSKAIFGNTDNITVFPSGAIAGVYARVDASKPGGVYVPPAGTEVGILRGCVGFEGGDNPECLDEKKRDLVFPENINPLTAFTGVPRHIDGARTLKGNGNFPTVAERRGMIYIEQSLKRGLAFAKHANNDDKLRATCARSTTAFMTEQMNHDAFASKIPDEAFLVDFGTGLNTTDTRFARQLIGRIGVATQKPAEFIILKFAQNTKAIDQAKAK